MMILLWAYFAVAIAIAGVIVWASGRWFALTPWILGLMWPRLLFQSAWECALMIDWRD